MSTYLVGVSKQLERCGLSHGCDCSVARCRHSAAMTSPHALHSAHDPSPHLLKLFTDTSLGRLGIWIISFLALAATLSGCEGSQPEGNNANVALEGIANNVILPGYEDLSSHLAVLDDAIATLCAQPNAQNLNAAQSAWKSARFSWKWAEPFYLGPAYDLRARSAFDWPSISADKLEGFVSDTTTTLSDGFFDNAPADVRGLGALEYLLFDADDGAPARGALAAFAADSTGRRCTYTRGLVGLMSRTTKHILSAWSPEGEDFLGDFSGKSRLTYGTSQEVVSAVVNGVVFAVEDAANLYLGVALRLDGALVFDPLKVPMHLSDHALADIEAMLSGAQAVYLGDGLATGNGIDTLVRARKAEVDDEVKAKFLAALAAIRAVEGPLEEAATERVSQVQAAFDAVKGLQEVLETGVSPVLGVSLTFNDNDGD